MKAPKTQPRLQHLTELSVRYPRMETKYEVSSICKWVRRIISSSPIKSLTLQCDTEEWAASGANVAFDSLIDHIVKKHKSTLRFLDLSSAFIGSDALKQLLTVCNHLETMKVCSGKDSLVCLLTHLIISNSVHYVIDNILHLFYRNVHIAFCAL